MKHCNNCGVDFPDDLAFCTRCGSKLVVCAPNSAETPDNPDNSTTQPLPPTSPAKPKKSGKKILKRVLMVIAVLLVLFVLWISHLMNSTTYMALNSNGEVFAKGGGQTEISIDYDGYIWEVSYKPDWVSISEHDNSFTVVCLPNESGSDREDHITVKSGKVVKAVPVGQYGNAQYIRLSESSLTSDMDGGSIYIDMSTDGVGPNISYPKFCEVEDASSEGFTLRVNSNSDYTRSGVVEVTEDNAIARISISQEGKCRECNGHGSRTCPSCGGFGSFSTGFYTTQCFTCGGSGEMKCYSCGGDGIK